MFSKNFANFENKIIQQKMAQNDGKRRQHNTAPRAKELEVETKITNKKIQ